MAWSVGTDCCVAWESCHSLRTPGEDPGCFQESLGIGGWVRGALNGL